MNKSKFLIIGIIAATVIAVAALIYMGPPFFIASRDFSFQEKELVLTSEYDCILQNKSVQVVADNDEIIWETDRDVKVQDALCADLDMDGVNELILLCWKRGRYGNSRPFWVERDTIYWIQHIYIYKPIGEDIHPLWMASDIGMQVQSWKSLKIGDLFFILVQDTKGQNTLWKWDSWGLKIADGSVRFVCVGDNLIQEDICNYGLYQEKSFDYLYEDYKSYIQDADFAVINQETIFVDNPEMYGGFPSFGSPMEVGEAMLKAGFNLVTCATNHALDRGNTGIKITTDFYETCGITYLGIKNASDEYMPYKVVGKNGIRVACFNYTYGVNNDVGSSPETYVNIIPEEDVLLQEIALARQEADAIVVFIHWGTEYETTPDESQKEIAELLNEAGVDVIVGTHPHVVQPMEIITSADGHETLVFYSLGNFISGQNIEGTDVGGIASFTFSYSMDGVALSQYSLEKIDLKY